MYSALKQAGRRLYELARQGIDVPREPRPVTIHALALLRHDADTLELEVRCSKGTYIRTLVEDIAAALGTVAHVTALRRYGLGPYTSAGMLDPGRLRELAAQGVEALDACLLPVDSAIADWPEVRLTAEMGWYLRRGQPVLAAGAPVRGWVRIYTDSGVFLGLGEMDAAGRVAPRRLVAND